MLVIDVTTRLGCMANGNKDIQNHPFFDSVNFVKIYHQSENPNNIPCRSKWSKIEMTISFFYWLDKPTKKDPLDPSSLSQAEEPIRVSRHNLHEEEFRMFWKARKEEKKNPRKNLDKYKSFSIKRFCHNQRRCGESCLIRIGWLNYSSHR